MGVSRGSLLPGNKIKETYKKNRNHIESGHMVQQYDQGYMPSITKGKKI